jgi:hypothetical protein
VRVWCLAEPVASAEFSLDDLWPEGPFIIFEGYVTGAAFRQNTASTELVLALTHWLSDLNFSSALSKQMHPLNPSQLYQPNTFTHNPNISGGAYLASVGPVQLPIHLSIPYFTPSVVLADFWGGVPVPGSDELYNQGGLK